MGKKKLAKYKPVKDGIDTQDAVMKAIVALDQAGVSAQKAGDYKTMAFVGLGWAMLSGPVHEIESSLRAAIEVADLQSDTERIVNKTGFSPGRPWDQEEEENDED